MDEQQELDLTRWVQDARRQERGRRIALIRERHRLRKQFIAETRRLQKQEEQMEGSKQ